MPGMYIPPIPPKKALGNKNDKFLEERKYFLERFLKLTCRISSIIKSDEFRIFARSRDEVEKSIKLLPEMTPEAILERLTTEFEMSEEEDEEYIKGYKTQIDEYVEFIKKIMPVLKSIRDKVRPMIDERNIQNQNYKNMIFLMAKYEEGALIEYANSNAKKLVVGNSMNPIYLDTADDVMEKLKNPFQEYYYWIKGEIYDIQAFNETIESRNRIMKLKEKTESKLKSDDSVLEKIKSGRSTLKTMFTGHARKEQFMSEMTVDIDKYTRHI